MAIWLVWAPISGLLAFLALKYAGKLRLQRRLNRWSNTPHDVVILHGFTRGKTLPNNSPYVLKVETFLRMAKIPYKFDGQDSFGPNGKTPWISINGDYVQDSHFIIEFLQKKFEPKLPHKYSISQVAVARALRVMLEERTFWGFVWDRFVWHGPEFMSLSSDSWLWKVVYRRIAMYWIKFQSYHHGIGRHAKPDLLRLTCDDLRTVSEFLGDKKYILGDEPCVDDCGIFGQVAQAVWAQPNSEYEELTHKECKNLLTYCERIKARFYPDWDACLG